MKLKRTAGIIIFCFILSIFPAFSVQAADVTVYVTKTGTKYHSKACGSGTYTASTLSTAKQRGLTACSKCWTTSPEEAVEEKAPVGETQTSQDTKKASSEDTKNTSGTSNKIKLSQTKLYTPVGEKTTLKLENASKGSTIKWSSSDKSVATVSSKGVVTAVATGTTTITAKAGGKKYKCTVTVLTAIDKAGKDTVWIPTNGGTKYHTKQDCSGMKNPVPVTREQAIELGFTKCKRSGGCVSVNK